MYNRRDPEIRKQINKQRELANPHSIQRIGRNDDKTNRKSNCFYVNATMYAILGDLVC